MEAWDDADVVRANAAGALAPGQVEMLLGDPPGAPVASLVIIGTGAVVSAVLAAVQQYGWAITVFCVLLSGGGGFSGTWFDDRRQRRRMRADLVVPRIAHGYGQVVPDPQGGVEIRTGTERIGLGRGVQAPPAPGRYHLYWLAHPHAQDWNRDRVLLSLQPLHDEPEPSYPVPAPGDSTRRLLARALGRTEWELRDNRAGRLSPPQRYAMVRSIRRTALLCTATLLVSVGCVAGTLLALRDPQRRASTTELIGSLLPAVFAAVGVVVAAVVLARLRSRRAILRAPAPVRQVTGPVTVERVALNGETDLDWRLSMGGLRFDLATDAARGFFDPSPYTVYYLPDGPVLLGAEPAPARPILGETWPQPDWAAVNASGELATEQRDQLIGGPVGPHLWLLFAIAAPLAGFMALNLIFEQTGRDVLEWVVGVGVPVACAVVWLAAYVLLNAMYRRRLRRVDMAQVGTSVGEVTWRAGRYRARAGHMTLRQVWTGVPPPEPGRYRFYWLAAGRPVLLSAMPVDSDDRR